MTSYVYGQVQTEASESIFFHIFGTFLHLLGSVRLTRRSAYSNRLEMSIRH